MRARGPVAQWLEPTAHNGLVAGSSPAGPTRSPPGRGGSEGEAIGGAYRRKNLSLCDQTVARFLPLVGAILNFRGCCLRVRIAPYLPQQDPPRLGRSFGSELRTPAGFLFLGEFRIARTAA